MRYPKAVPKRPLSRKEAVWYVRGLLNKIAMQLNRTGIDLQRIRLDLDKVEEILARFMREDQ